MKKTLLLFENMKNSLKKLFLQKICEKKYEVMLELLLNFIFH